MRLATWNVNSLKVRLPQVLDWLKSHQPDVLCLQETKLVDTNFPTQDLRTAGYEVLFSGQKTYNGVAILTRHAAREALAGIPGFSDPQKRVLAASIGGLRVICLYVPNGQSVDSDKYRYKLDWLAAATAWLRGELAANPRLAVVGDFNIAPEERDVHDPEAWEGQVLFSAPERQAFQDLLALGLKDGFRLFDQPEQSFTWWDYRMNAFKRRMGLRIDHILLSASLARTCRSCTIDTEPREAERPSDHAPVIADLEL
ncbi:MAG: exodeoxyribonuclease III [Betaproteobacteria bacterium]|nr:exodeoxyribonuclease III [Betaproteobacteria bacterium]